MLELIKPNEKKYEQENEEVVEAYCSEHSGWCIINGEDDEPDDILF